MPKSLRYLLFVAVTAIVVYGAYTALQERRSATAEAAGELVFPQFGAVINEIAQIKGMSEEGPYTLVRKDGTWVLVERGGYPANPVRVGEMLVGVSQMKLIEPKTSKPERYSRLGLADPGKEGSPAHRITFEDGAGKVRATMILGEYKAARGEPNMSEVYLLRGDDPQAWLALTSAPNIRGTVDWLDDELLKIDDKRIASVEVRHEDGEVVTVLRKPGHGQGYELQNVPAGRTVDSEYVVRNVASTLVNMQLDDVMPAATWPLEGEKPISFTVKTYDGLRIDIDSVKVKDDRRVQLRAQLLETPPEAPPVADDADEDAKIVALDREAVQKQIADFNARWQGYTFELGDWRLAPSYKRNAEFLAKPEEPAKGAGQAPDAGLIKPGPVLPLGG